MIGVMVLMTACGGSGGGKSAEPVEKSPKVNLKPSASGQELESYLKAGFASLNQLNLVSYMDDSVAVEDAGADASSTNTQVAGVDEGDFWQYNGHHFYYRNPTQTGVVSVVKPGDDPAIIGDIDLGFNISELYASATHLVALSPVSYPSYWGMPTGYDGSNQGELAVWDISQVNASTDSAEAVLSVQLQGDMVSSRKVGDELYLVTRHTAYLKDWIDYPQSDADIAANQRLLDAASLDDFLPTITVNGQGQSLLQEAGCYLVQDEANGYPTLTSLTRINTLTGEFTNNCVAGPVDGLYMSQNSAYLFSSATDFSDFIDSSVVDEFGEPTEQTHIHKFALNADLDYLASNVVAGYASCNEARYCFGELDDGSLAVVTTYGWWQDIEHHLAILNPGDLAVQARLPNESAPVAIGKPGERLYAARILGNRAYLVTFKTIDPLYVLDLSNIASPVMMGELEIPGFSDYLHPINDSLLLGIGKDVATDEFGNALEQGVKVDLFDVSNMSQPAQLASFSLGKRGSSTEVSWDSHAFTSHWQGNQFRFVIPVDISEVSINDSDQSQDPSYHHPHSYTGFQAFEVDIAPGTNANIYALPASKIPGDYSSNQWVMGSRATIIGDDVYLFQRGRVFVTHWENIESLQTVD
ncbi:beta-propeller domain-containing protein [Halioxenophilus aromaticivorans]|uniref:Beta-propeller domain-containing protein n=1 Tax=Halioxenophilus aromaticivorans TaxID=1306992 RepID=A0AAV3U131_9ALTE